MNKKLMIVMMVVGMSAVYVRFQIIGMESGDRVEQARQRAERERAAVAAAAAPGEVEQDREGFYGFLRSKREADEEAQNKALELNMRHGNFPAEMQESVLSHVPFPLPPKVMAFLCHKLCTPTKVRTLLHEQLSHEQAVYSVAFSPDGRLLATGCGDETVGIWNVANGQKLKTLQCGDGEESIYSVAFSPDGRLLAIGSEDEAGIWDVESGTRLRTLPCDGITLVVFSPDGELLASKSDDGVITIWNVANGEIVRTFGEYGDDRNFESASIAFSSDGTRLAIALNEGAVDIWNVARGELVQKLSYHYSANSGVFSPSGKKLATRTFAFNPSMNKTVVIWDVESKKRLQELQCDDAVYSVAFSPDEKLLVIGAISNRGTAEIWDVRSGNRLQIVECGRGKSVSEVIFSPDGKLLATASGRNVLLWNMECLQTIERSTITTFAHYQLMEGLEKTLANKPNGTVRIVRKLAATPEQWAAFETLPTDVQTALRALIRNEEDQKKAAHYWSVIVPTAAAAGNNSSKRQKVEPIEKVAVAAGKEEEGEGSDSSSDTSSDTDRGSSTGSDDSDSDTGSHDTDSDTSSASAESDMDVE